jgi:hypothetical protein
VTNSINLSVGEYEAILRTDLPTFVERCFRELHTGIEFIPGQYIELVAAKLELCRQRKITRLAICLPPRTLKSHIASVAYSAWLHGHDPEARIMCVSYGQDLASKHALDCRTIMSSAFYRQLFRRTSLSASKQAINDFYTTRNGFRMSTSVGGVVTGRRHRPILSTVCAGIKPRRLGREEYPPALKFDGLSPKPHQLADLWRRLVCLDAPDRFVSQILKQDNT